MYWAFGLWVWRPRCTDYLCPLCSQVAGSGPVMSIDTANLAFGRLASTSSILHGR